MFYNPDYFHGQVVVGLIPSLANIAVHAIVMALVSWTAHRTSLATSAAHGPIRIAATMMAAVAVLMLAHIIEIALWAATYMVLAVAPDQTDAFYLAFVNYTTLGYGDVLPTRRWRLLGPMAAMNGVLLFGWSTAVIYDLLRTVTQVIPMKSRESS